MYIDVTILKCYNSINETRKAVKTMKRYIVTYEKNGTTQTAKFASREFAKQFAMNRLNEGSTPVKISTRDGEKVIYTKTYCK